MEHSKLIEASDDKKNYFLMTTILFFCGLSILTSMYIPIPLISVFSSEFQVSTNQAAWVGSAFSLFYALGCLIYGPFSDRYGRKVFLLTSIIILTVVTFILGFIDSFYWLIIFRAIQGIVAAAFVPISLVYTGEMFPPSKRLTAIGFISTGLLMAGIVGQVMSELIHNSFGWHSIFYFQSMIYFISSLLVLRFLPREDLTEKNGSVLKKIIQMKVLFKNKQLLLAFSITFMLLLVLVGMYTVLGSYLIDLGLTDDEILYIRAVGIVGMFLSPFAGGLSKRFGIINVLRGSLALSVVGIMGLGLFTALPILIFMSVIFVAGIALVTPVNLTLITQMAGNVRGSAISFNAFILFLGASLGPVIAIQLLKTENFTLSFEVLGFLLIMGLLSSFFIKIAVPSNAS